MKRKTSILITMLLAFPCIQATMSAQLQMIIMGGQYDSPNKENDPLHRAPASPIKVWQDEHTFTFSPSYIGNLVEVRDKGIVIYRVSIMKDGKITIPNYISGNVELFLITTKVTYRTFVNLT